MICRVCLENSRKHLEIFDKNGIKNQIAGVINKHFWFEPLPTDIVSKVICKICWSKIKDFHIFYESVRSAHDNFYNESVLFKVEPELDEQQLEIICGIETHLDTNVDVGDDSDIDNDANATQKDIKIEPLEDPLNAEFTITTENSGAPEMVVYNDDKEIIAGTTDAICNIVDAVVESQNTHEKQQIKNFRKTTKIQKKLKTLKVKKLIAKKIKRSKRETTDNSKNEDDNDEEFLSCEEKFNGSQSKKPRKKLNISDQELIKRHIAFGCDLCVYVGENFADIARHFGEQHPNIRPYITCCGRQLKRNFMVKQHALKHENPEHFKCTECNKVFANNDILRYHEITQHIPDADLRFSCDQCPRKFARRYLLERHKSLHIPLSERKFVCELCPDGRAFAGNHLLQIHISMKHKKTGNICHFCAKVIRDKHVFEKHLRGHTGECVPRVKCPKPGCESWLKDEDSLKTHLRRHNDDGKIFTCEKCGKVCGSQPALKSHKRYSHSDQIYSCGVCDKIFKRALTLKEHMAGHTGESLYKCPFCERTFNSNANMHSHKKKMHPIEWEKWYKGKYGNLKRGKEAAKVRNNNEANQEDDVDLNAEQFIETNENCLVTIELDDE